MSTIHFTSFSTNYRDPSDRDQKGLENLLGIIKNGFKFSSRRTYITHQNGISTELWIQMICFAELSALEVKNNQEKFGRFGICMKKAWLNKYFAQPVLYTMESSYNNNILNRLNSLITDLLELSKEFEVKKINELSLQIADLSMLFQALTEPMNHYSENELRIINYPNNPELQNDLNYHQEIKDDKNGVLYYSVPYLPFSIIEDIDFVLIPESFYSEFLKGVHDSQKLKSKIRFFEKFIDC